MRLLKILWYYWHTKHLIFKQRADLEAYQIKQLKKFKQRVLTKSPYFSQFINQPFESWPLMNKQLMMAHFDQMNTENLTCDSLLTLAQHSEQQRDFSARMGKFSVGLSSGTSGQRGLFVVSPREQLIWAGGILAKMLPRGLLTKERVALFLRADNHLYHSTNSHWLTFRFYGLFDNFQQQIQSLNEYQPTIIVAPAQVLRALATEKLNGKLTINPVLVISAAEVLEDQDKQIIKQVFNQLAEVYQATEGFLAATCPLGTLHLNEEFIYIEPCWLDENRFMPIITDFTRETQPIVRYQLDDILVRRQTPCLCGRQGMAISHIEGRCDDQLSLTDQQGNPLTIFADYCSRVIANNLPLTSDYRLIQHQDNSIELIACCSQAYLSQCQQALTAHFIQQGANVTQLKWKLMSVTTIPAEFSQKRRRIIRERGVQ
ncbi:CoF synthetase [Snodgrassella sp. ESL0323]|uniref:F390 synthetase-related protein n=1 Tax=Snodgrassella sp. ESL0323 TaxID=2705034 RepID=UPI001581D977|nr:F390 synthetase-related protein [Snodgrassella sp. ESL0323]NUF77686.1 CoF synthetase [Snodgrassella sp. ESL0323]